MLSLPAKSPGKINFKNLFLSVLINIVFLSVRLWKTVIEKPKFWRWARLTVSSDNYQEVLQSLRVKIVPEIKISIYDLMISHLGFVIPSSSMLAVLENLFTAVVDGSSSLKTLQVMHCSSVNLRAMDPVLLSQALIRLEECSFWEYSPDLSLSTAQLVSLFTAIDQTDDLKLRVLNLPHTDFSEVPPAVLAAALVKLEETDILSAPLRPEHVRSLFSKIVESPMVNIKKLNPSLEHFNEAIPPELFADALVRIDTVDGIDVNPFSEDDIDNLNLASLLRKIANSEIPKLRQLSFSWARLSNITSPV